MIRWLVSLAASAARLFRRRPARGVFEWFDGLSWRASDPLPAWAALEAALEDFPGTLRKVSTPPLPGTPPAMAEQMEKERRAAGVKVADAVCVAFDVAPFKDGTGLTQAERIRLAAGFLSFMSSLREQSRPS